MLIRQCSLPVVMPTCADCASYTPKSKERGECRINGETPPDRDTDRCPSRTFARKPERT